MPALLAPLTSSESRARAKRERKAGIVERQGIGHESSAASQTKESLIFWPDRPHPLPGWPPFCSPVFDHGTPSFARAGFLDSIWLRSGFRRMVPRSCHGLPPLSLALAKLPCVNCDAGSGIVATLPIADVRRLGILFSRPASGGNDTGPPLLTAPGSSERRFQAKWRFRKVHRVENAVADNGVIRARGKQYGAGITPTPCNCHDGSRTASQIGKVR